MIRAAIEEWKSAPPYFRFAFSLVFIVSLISVLFGFLNYPVIGHDAYVHLNWFDQFPKLHDRGIFYPRWLPESFGGYGSPTFYFYAPLVYWIASVFYFVGLHSPSTLYQAVQLIFSIVSVFTCYILFRQMEGTRLRSLLGALVYSFLAYRFCDVYVRDALTEHAALTFLPLVFLRFHDRLRVLSVNSIGWAGLFFTNLPITYIAVISVGVLILARRSFREIPIHLASFVIGVLVSACYLFPAFAMRGLVHQRHLFDLPMHTSQFGFALLDLFQRHIDWLRILSVGTIMAALPLLKKEGAGGWSRNGWTWLIILAIFLQIPFIASPFWHLFPGMPFVQFSWRWNGILLLAIAVFFAKKESNSINWIIIGLALITLLSELTLSRNIFNHPPSPINSYMMDAPEYAPKWSSDDPNEVIAITQRRMGDAPAVLLGFNMPDDSVSLISKSPIEWRFKVNLSRATPVRFHQFYWPYWKLHRDSTEISLAPDPNGLTTAELAEGQYTIALRLEESKSEIFGGIASFIGLVIFAVLFSVGTYRWITKWHDEHPVHVTTRSV